MKNKLILLVAVALMFTVLISFKNDNVEKAKYHLYNAR